MSESGADTLNMQWNSTARALPGFGEILRKVKSARSMDEIGANASRACEWLVYDSFFVVMKFRTVGVESTNVVLHNLNEDELARLATLPFYAPAAIVEHCRNRATPLIWSEPPDVAANHTQGCTGSIVLNSASLLSGISFPMHNCGTEWGMLTFTTLPGGASTSNEVQAGVGTLFSGYLQEAIRRVSLGRETLCGAISLTQRERECLAWTLDGKTSQEVAKILKVSARTVVFHLQNAMSKLGATNRINAAVKIMSTLLTHDNQNSCFLGSVTPRGKANSKLLSS